MRSWKQLGIEIGVEALDWTIKKVMGSLEYHEYLACQRSWQLPGNAVNQVEYAQKMLEKYPRPKDWDRVRFSVNTLMGEGITSIRHCTQA